MNNPKEIIVKLKSNNNSFMDNNIETLEEQLDYWISFLKEKFSKRLYKRVLKEIKTKNLMEKYGICPRGWELTIISIKTKLKIIKNKIIKYNVNNNDAQKDKVQMNHCKKYLDLIKIEFNELFNNNYNSNTKLLNNLDIVDELLLCYSKYIYISYLFNKKIGNFIESLNYLILIINFYKETNSIIKSPNTLYYIQKCYLLLCQVLISNKDYLMAIEFINILIVICFKNIIFQVKDINNGVFIGNLRDINYRNNIKELKYYLNDLKLKKVFLNITIIFLYKAICHENLGEINKSIECYKQCDWFSSKFLKKEKNFNIFSTFIHNLKEKYIELILIYDNFVKKINDYEKMCLLKDRLNKDKNNNEIINYSQYYSSNNKYKDLMKKVNSLKVREIDTISKFSQKKNIKNLNSHRRAGKDKNIYLDNMRLLEAYLRKDFRPIILDMDKIKLFDLDYNIRERGQKQIYRANYEKIRKKKAKLKLNNNSFNKISLRKTFKENKLLHSPYIENKKDFRIQKYKSMKINSPTPNNKSMKVNSSTPNNKTIKLKPITFKDNINTNKIITSSNYKVNNTTKSLLTTDSIEENNNNNTKKINYKLFVHLYKQLKKRKEIEFERKMNIFFNKNYLIKRNYIKNIEDKELEFQKLYLQSKIKPISPIPSTDELVIKRSANNYFYKLKSLINIKPINDEDKIISEDERKINDSFFKSLDSKILDDYFQNRNKIRKNKEIIKLLNNNEIEKNNRSVLDKLNETINIINKIQISKNKDIIYKKMNINKKIPCFKRYTSISPHKKRSKFILSPNKILYKKIKK